MLPWQGWFPSREVIRVPVGKNGVVLQLEGLKLLSWQRDRKGLIRILGVVEDATVWFVLCKWITGCAILRTINTLIVNGLFGGFLRTILHEVFAINWPQGGYYWVKRECYGVLGVSERDNWGRCTRETTEAGAGDLQQEGTPGRAAQQEYSEIHLHIA